MAAEVAKSTEELGIVEVADERGHRAAAGSLPGQAVAQLDGIRPQQPLVLLVRHVVDAPAKRLAAGAGEHLA